MSPQKLRKISVPRVFRVLVVEDNMYRVSWFTDKLFGLVTALTCALNNKAALGILSTDAPFDLVFLDHDNEEGDFLPVAKRLKELSFSGPVIIHSMNPVGAKNMSQLLQKEICVHAPFGTFELEII